MTRHCTSLRDSHNVLHVAVYLIRCIVSDARHDKCTWCRAEVPHVASALEAMVKLCSDPQLVVDFFVNYDCDLQVRSAALAYILCDSCTCRRCPLLS